MADLGRGERIWGLCRSFWAGCKDIGVAMWQWGRKAKDMGFHVAI